MNPDLMSAIVEQAKTAPEPAVDLLLERGATLAEVLLAYAGTPPHWTDGLPQTVLAEWLARSSAAAAGKVDERAAKVREAAIDRTWYGELVAADPDVARYINALAVEASWYAQPTEFNKNHPAIQAAAARLRPVIERELKRRVLALFPSEERGLQYTVSHRQIKDWRASAGGRIRATLIRGGFRMDLPIDRQERPWDRTRVYTQYLFAPDWIPPSEEERARDVRREAERFANGLRSGEMIVLPRGATIEPLT